MHIEMAAALKRATRKFYKPFAVAFERHIQNVKKESKVEFYILKYDQTLTMIYPRSGILANPPA
jgi:hypothetical protein